MYSECTSANRRSFLAEAGGALALLGASGATQRIAAAEGAVATQKKELLPTVPLGEHRITRMVAGYNPIGGYSHSSTHLSRIMREYFTAERTAEFLQHCENQGLNTWQYDHTDKCCEAIRLARDRGCGMQLICLHAERPHDAKLDEVVKNKPLAIVHHGGVTDGLFRGGKADKVRDFVKKVKDAGVLAGVSAHNPDNIKRIADEQWENDLFMTCFYYVTRPRDEMKEQMGKVPVGEPFFESDPDDMTAVVRQVDKPCLGFKILAAGRRCSNKHAVGSAFRYAFANIKKTDAVIVGMFPKFDDEVAQNADFARQYGGVDA